MGIDVQEVMNGRLGVGFALWLGRVTPPGVAHRLSSFIADRVAGRRSWEMVRAVRANQWVVSGGTLSADELDRRVRETFRHTARCLYDYYHHLDDPTAPDRLVTYESRADELLTALSRGEETAILVGPHLSNFDLVARAITARGVGLMALAFSQPGSGYQWQNDLRRQWGIDVAPASTASLLKAARRLRAGGSVMSGLDRPLPGSPYRPRFFGRPAPLSAMHVMLGLKTGVPVYVLAAVMRPDGVYDIQVSNPIEMVPGPDRRETLVTNAERVLVAAEGFIRLAPSQWSMFYPVWPEALEEVTVIRG